MVSKHLTAANIIVNKVPKNFDTESKNIKNNRVVVGGKLNTLYTNVLCDGAFQCSCVV